MKKLTFLLITIAVTGLLISTIHLGNAQTSTPVNGIINSDTTWTKTNSPYNLTGPVAINQGVALTIEAGTSVNLNGYYIQVNGTLNAIGTSTSQIFFTGSAMPSSSPNYGILFTSSSTGWNQQTGNGSIIENAVLQLISISSSVKISNCDINDTIVILSGSPIITENNIGSVLVYGGSPSILANLVHSGPYVFGGNPISVMDGSPLIANNTITGSSYPDNVGRASFIHDGINLLSGSNVSIVNNSIFGPFDDAGISISGGNPTILRNYINNTFGSNSAAIKINNSSVNSLILNNTISVSANTIGIATTASSVLINYNNIQASSQSIYLLSGATDEVNATYNWWGTTDIQVINQTIHDFKNDFNLGVVNFIPFLTAPNPQTSSSFSVNTLPTTSSSATPTVPEYSMVIIIILIMLLTLVLSLLGWKRQLNSR